MNNEKFKILGLINARSGSKSVPNKNITPAKIFVIKFLNSNAQNPATKSQPYVPINSVNNCSMAF